MALAGGEGIKNGEGCRCGQNDVCIEINPGTVRSHAVSGAKGGDFRGDGEIENSHTDSVRGDPDCIIRASVCHNDDLRYAPLCERFESIETASDDR